MSQAACGRTVGGNAAANGLVGGGIGATSTVANNLINGESWNKDILKGALVGVGAGAGGSIVGDGFELLRVAAVNRAVSSATSADRVMAQHLADTTRPALPPTQPAMVGIADTLLSNFISGAGSRAQNCSDYDTQLRKPGCQ